MSTTITRTTSIQDVGVLSTQLDSLSLEESVFVDVEKTQALSEKVFAQFSSRIDSLICKNETLRQQLELVKNQASQLKLVHQTELSGRDHTIAALRAEVETMRREAEVATTQHQAALAQLAEDKTQTLEMAQRTFDERIAVLEQRVATLSREALQIREEAHREQEVAVRAEKSVAEARIAALQQEVATKQRELEVRTLERDQARQLNAAIEQQNQDSTKMETILATLYKYSPIGVYYKECSEAHIDDFVRERRSRPCITALDVALQRRDTARWRESTKEIVQYYAAVTGIGGSVGSINQSLLSERQAREKQ